MTDDQKTLLSVLDGDDFTFNPSRLAAAVETMQEWLDSGDVPHDVRQDFMLARDSMEAFYMHITLVHKKDWREEGYMVTDAYGQVVWDNRKEVI